MKIIVPAIVLGAAVALTACGSSFTYTSAQENAYLNYAPTVTMAAYSDSDLLKAGRDYCNAIGTQYSHGHAADKKIQWITSDRFDQISIGMAAMLKLCPPPKS